MMTRIATPINWTAKEKNTAQPLLVFPRPSTKVCSNIAGSPFPKIQDGVDGSCPVRRHRLLHFGRSPSRAFPLQSRARRRRLRLLLPAFDETLPEDQNRAGYEDG